MKILIPIILGLSLVSCNPKKPPTAIIPPPPEAVESALPTLKKGNISTDNAVEDNTKFTIELDKAYQEIYMQKVSIGEALAQAEKMKQEIDENKQITALQIQDLIAILQTVKERNLFLELSNKNLTDLTKSQELSLKEVKKAFNDAEELIVRKDYEVKVLKQQNEHFVEVIKSQEDIITKLEKSIDKSNKKLATASVYRNWIIGIAIAIGLYLLITKALSLYSPFLKR